VASLAILWITIGYSVFAIRALWVRIVLLVVAAGVTIHLQMLPSEARERAPE
jgi:hypothetical protein